MPTAQAYQAKIASLRQQLAEAHANTAPRLGVESLDVCADSSAVAINVSERSELLASTVSLVAPSPGSATMPHSDVTTLHTSASASGSSFKPDSSASTDSALTRRDSAQCDDSQPRRLGSILRGNMSLLPARSAPRYTRIASFQSPLSRSALQGSGAGTPLNVAGLLGTSSVERSTSVSGVCNDSETMPPEPLPEIVFDWQAKYEACQAELMVARADSVRIASERDTLASQLSIAARRVEHLQVSACCVFIVFLRTGLPHYDIDLEY